VIDPLLPVRRLEAALEDLESLDLTALSRRRIYDQHTADREVARCELCGAWVSGRRPCTTPHDRYAPERTQSGTLSTSPPDQRISA
jgi:hypothetical protein